MAVKVGTASTDENGNTSGGKAGDQTKKQVYTRDWYSKPWTVLLRPNSSTVAEKLAKACQDACANDNIGYDQNERNTLHTQAKKVSYDLSKITTSCECDCSSLATVCAIAGGVTDLEYSSNAPTTSTMQSKFTATGKFTAYTSSKYLDSDNYLLRGDILLKPGSHTVIVLGNGSKASTSSSSSTLTVDGEIGSATVTRLQKVLGTTQDGFIDGQNSSYKKYYTSILSSVCKWSGGSSAVVKAWQKLVGASQDGVLGQKTAKSIQNYLINKGYSCGSSGADGYFGTNSAKALQKWLNAQ